MIWMLPVLAILLLVYAAVPASEPAQLSHASAVLQDLDITIKKHANAKHDYALKKHDNAHGHSGCHGTHTAAPPAASPPPPPSARPPLDRSTATLYAIPVLMICLGFVGCYRRSKLRSKCAIRHARQPRCYSPRHSTCCSRRNGRLHTLLATALSAHTTRTHYWPSTRYSIGGSAISDFLCHCCCTSCSIAREAREIRTQAVHEAISTVEDYDD